MGNFSPVKLNLSEVARIAKSSAVQSQLAPMAASIAASASAKEASRRDDKDAWMRSAYRGRVKVLDKSAVGIVETTGTRGLKAQALHGDLDEFLGG